MSNYDDEEYIDYNEEYDENEVDWNEKLYELDDIENDDDEDIDEDNESDEDSETTEVLELSLGNTSLTAKTFNKQIYKTTNITDKWVSIQLAKSEYARDRVKFKYDGSPIYGHILMKVPTGNRYLFDIVDPCTGVHSIKALKGELID